MYSRVKIIDSHVSYFLNNYNVEKYYVILLLLNDLLVFFFCEKKPLFKNKFPWLSALNSKLTISKLQLN